MCREPGRFQVKLLSLLLLGIALVGSGPARADDQVPVKGMVTMVDLGADNCLPCRMMTPIIAELKKTYKGKAAIVFIDVYHDNTAAAKRFKAMIIPTQIFFDRNGKEVSRNEGFMEKAAIMKELDDLLARKE
jgi:thioredoxin 1